MARHLINKKYCKAKTLLFFPKTDEEATLIQRNLFKLGYSWVNKSQKIDYLKECVRYGMALNSDGNIIPGPNSEDNRLGEVCFLEQFESNESLIIEDLEQSISLLSGKARRKLLKNIKNSFSNDFAIAAGSIELIKTKRPIKIKTPPVINKKS